ncbi:sigma-E processing peptidase SpoIIGA [Petroclostridium sp. X23]|uniref:sigma-E processing peptidase SpoIIGA n=1 Tax=Petroclostridium sp. X23 TaxID=3045146 RepID=UPI0024AD6CC4|nr:sigma-E processing peptidase SpoIIGA [Petroclostridium sp. X23]WHH58898.1 sigma-E processing peptidase SpoIIGA [Petroclostridium sp. X23]
MKPVVYVDVLFIINFLVNYMLLWTTGKILKRNMSMIRLIIAAVIGAFYAVIMFFPAFKIYYTMLAKVLFSMMLVAVAYNVEKVKDFFRVLATFYVVSFTFGGTALGLFYFTDIGAFAGAMLSNGIIYFNLPWKTLVISSITAYIIIRITWRMFQRNIHKDNMLIPLHIIFDSRSICVDALIDTGNSLHDPISNFPVVIVEFQAIKELLPEEIQRIFNEYGENDLNIISKVMSDSLWISRFRLIPFSSLGKENGMLIGFKPDEVEIVEGDHKKDLKDIIVGIYNKRLSKDDKYRALLHPEVIG